MSGQSQKLRTERNVFFLCLFSQFSVFRLKLYQKKTNPFLHHHILLFFSPSILRGLSDCNLHCAKAMVMPLPLNPIDALRIGVTTVFVKVHAVEVAMLTGMIPKIGPDC
jgi:hypothetical protein